MNTRIQWDEELAKAMKIQVANTFYGKKTEVVDAMARHLGVSRSTIYRKMAAVNHNEKPEKTN